MMRTILDVEHLNVSLGSEQILENISFTVHEKDVVVIVGPNGAGKTTLLKTLLGLIPHTGTITWNNKNISYLPPQELLHRKDLPPLTIEEFFLFKKVHKEKIITMLDAVGLDPAIRFKQFTALSTGQFQRMLVAWALIKDPSILLFDEPAAGIDIGGEETIYSLLHTFWKKKGLTIILVTHNIDIIWKHATHVLCINKKLLCYESPEIALTQENLKKLYGTGVTLYEHRHE